MFYNQRLDLFQRVRAPFSGLIFIGGNSDTDALPAQKNRNLGSGSGLLVFGPVCTFGGESPWLKPLSAIQLRWLRQMKARSRIRKRAIRSTA
jgi:hypothetical protein